MSSNNSSIDSSNNNSSNNNSSKNSSIHSELTNRLNAKLNEAGFPPSTVKATVSKDTIDLFGRVIVDVGSDLNILVDEFIEQNKLPITKVSRAGVTFYRPKPKEATETTYELSPDNQDLIEHSETKETFERKVQFMIRKIRKSKHFVIYTGAGISTAAKIPDFRGPKGVWTARDRNLPPPKSIRMEQAVPTFAHMALVKLQDTGIMKYLISQNVDGLHLRSGIKQDKISELHGNCYLEVCNNPSCKTAYLRTYDVTSRRGDYFVNVKDTESKSGISHITGRICDKCKKGMLRDSIIHFGETLPERALELATEHSSSADLAFCVGTSLKVTPACQLPQNCSKNHGIMCILNLQNTGKDIEALNRGGILIHAKCDEFFTALMQGLNLDVPNAPELKLEEEPSQKRLSVQEKIARARREEKERINAQAIEIPCPDHFYIGNFYEYDDTVQDDNKHKWTLFVSCDESLVTPCHHFIDHVNVVLHHTFSPNKITLKPDDLTLTRYGWGTFDIMVTVHFVPTPPRKGLSIFHTLNFDQKVSSTKIAVPIPQINHSSIFDQLLSRKQQLKPVQTVVTTITGEQYVDQRKESKSNDTSQKQ